MESTTDNPANQPSDDTQPADEQVEQVVQSDESAKDVADKQVEQSDESAKDVEASRAQSAAVVEAILFATDSPISAGKMATVAELPQRVIKQAIAALNERYEANGTSVRIEELAGGYQMLTQSQFHEVLSRLLRVKSESRLSQAALETLAIVAYRQPILRADIEAIRGVACGEMLRGLMEKNLVKIVGRAEVLGRPMLYGTTKRFLEVFGLSGLDDLPRVDELRTAASQVITNPAQPSDDAEESEGEPAGEAAEVAKGDADGASETAEQSAQPKPAAPQPTASDDDPDAAEFDDEVDDDEDADEVDDDDWDDDDD